MTVSAILGVWLPSHGSSETPLVTTAPSRSRSTNSAYSRPEANVPDATMTGLASSSPAMFTLRSTLNVWLP